MLFDDLGNTTGTNGATAFTDSEAEAFFHSDRVNEFAAELNIVARHDHFGAFRKVCNTGNVGGAEVELRTIAIEEWGVTATFVLGKDVNLTLEFRVRSNRAGLAENLTTNDVFTLDTTEEAADVVASLSLVEELTEHLDARANRLLGVLDTNDLEFVVDVENATLNTAGSNGATTGDGHGVFNSHEEGLVNVALRSRNVAINCFHELPDLVLISSIAFKSLESRTADDRGVVSRELIRGEKFTNFHLNELEELFVVDHVALVEEYDDVRNANLTSEQDVLTSLSHRTVGCCDNEDRTVHLSSTGDHVLDVVGMARAVNVCIVTGVGFVLDVSDGDGNTTLALFRSFIDVFKSGEVCSCRAVRTVV